MDNGYIPPLPAESADPLSTRPSSAEVNFTITMLLQSMSKLKNKLSAGPDGLPPIFFKNLINSLAPPLTKLFNELMHVG